MIDLEYLFFVVIFKFSNLDLQSHQRSRRAYRAKRHEVTIGRRRACGR